MTESMPNHEFVTVARTEAISEGEGISRMVAGRMIALFRHQGEILAVNDICPHMGASLGAGHLDEEGVVTCPWHAWRFSVCDGSWRDNPRLKIETYETRVVGDEVQIRVPMDE